MTKTKAGKTKGAVETSAISTIDDTIAQTYKEMIRKFCLPECSDIIHSMKHFVGSFNDNVQKLDNNKNSSDESNNNSNNNNKNSNHENADNLKRVSSNDPESALQRKTISRLASSVHNFLQTLYSTIYLHPLWNDGDGDYDNELAEDIKRALEIFVYSKCYRSIFKMVSNEKDDVAMGNRLDFLQFVNPSHLDMHCLIDDNAEEENNDISNDNDDGENANDDNNIKNGNKENWNRQNFWRTRLAKPIITLQSLPTHYSPSQMLSCILESYRQVNEALISLSTEDQINDDGDTKKDDGSGTTKLPGADDLLPALILTTIASRPNQIVSILNFIDGFATDEEMRGEAGYAYTNLYCAVQFIRELDLDGGDSIERSLSISSSQSVVEDNRGGKKPSLSISPEELRAMIKRCRDDSADRAALASNRDMNTTNKTARKDTASDEVRVEVSSSLEYVPIPINEVRAARLRGDEIYAWARRRWMEGKSGTAAESNNIYIGACSRIAVQGMDLERPGRDAISLASSKEQQAQQPQVLPLPEGFTRTYNYVSTDPDDVRMSEIPSLLKEYRMLVLGLETFLADQTTRQNNYQKEEIKRMRCRLEMDASEAEATIRD